MEYCAEIRVGNSRRKTQDISLCLSNIKCSGEGEWTYRVFCSGLLSEDRTLEGNSPFDCVTLGLAFLRQALRQLVKENPKYRFYEEVEGKLEEISIEDIFWTHDCVTDEIEETIQWAKDNGYKKNEL